MDFIHTDLGNRKAGETVEITLSGNAANVRLLDSLNFSSYRNGRRHRYYGGLAKQSPRSVANSHIQVIGTSAVDMQGLGEVTFAHPYVCCLVHYRHFKMLPYPMFLACCRSTPPEDSP